MARTLTVANSVITLGVSIIFPTPRQIQGYAADDVFSTQPVQSTETVAGVDKRLSAGYVFVPKVWSLNLMADSESNDFFDEWENYQETTGETYPCFGVVILPSISKKYTMSRGFMTSWPPMPDGGKLLRSRRYGITWETMVPEPI